MNLEQKREMIDGDLYRFIRYCKQLIPKDAVIYYVPAIDIYDSIYSSHPFWAQELYFRRKLEYYFFPQRIIFLKSNFKNFNMKIIKPNFTNLFYLCY